MIDKVKYYAPAFTNKASFPVTSTGISMLLTEIEKLIEECNEELESAGLSGCCYSSKQEEIVKLQEDMDRLGRYVMSAGEYISAKLDDPLWRDFQNHATHSLSEIVLEDLHTENVIGVQEYYDVDSYSGREKVAVIKSQLTFEDFLTIKDLEEGEGLPLLDGMENIREFAEMFCPEYNQFCEQGCSMGECVEILLEQGEYGHHVYHPAKDFISSVLDVTIIKPIVECFLGKDLITKKPGSNQKGGRTEPDG